MHVRRSFFPDVISSCIGGPKRTGPVIVEMQSTSTLNNGGGSWITMSLERSCGTDIYCSVKSGWAYTCDAISLRMAYGYCKWSYTCYAAGVLKHPYYCS